MLACLAHLFTSVLPQCRGQGASVLACLTHLFTSFLPLCRRKDEFGRQGWPMKRHEYEHLLSIVKPRALQ